MADRPAPASPGLVSYTRWLGDGEDPLDHLRPGGFAWFADGEGFVASGCAARIVVGPGRGRLVGAAAEVARVLASVEVFDDVVLPGTGPIAVGAPGFSPSQTSALVVPEWVVGRTADGRSWQTHVTGFAPGSDNGEPHEDPEPQTEPLPAATDREAFLERVRAALELIRSGVVTKVVVARQDLVTADVDPVTVLRRLVDRQPDCFVYACGNLVGASPELLVSRRGAEVVSRPMAGTVPRSGREADDELRATWLASSPKEREEHRAVVGAVSEALAVACREVSVTGPELARFTSVSHLVSTVRGRLDPARTSALELAGLLHPTPAVAGLPVEAALAAIADLEPFSRGPYGGPVGWVGASGDGDWAVAIRCAQLGLGRATLVAGAGIVAGSGPESEWAETEAKLAPMREALGQG